MRNRIPLNLFTAAGTAVIGLAVGTSAFAASFTQVDPSAIASTGERLNDPEYFTAFNVDLTQLSNDLALAPIARVDHGVDPVVVELPLADGMMTEFYVWNSPVMHPDLAARYPELQTFEGRAVEDNTMFTRFSITPKGFHGVIRTSEGKVWIDPYQTNDIQHVVATTSRHYRRAGEFAAPSFTCGYETDPVAEQTIADLVNFTNERGSTSVGPELRTYRTAVAATGEYTSFHGGTVAAGMAAIVTAINRVNEVYQLDLSIFLELIPNNDDIVYTNGGTDPYNNNNGSQMLGQNINNLNAVIGSANFDLGHVFSTGGGGIAFLGVVCGNNKAGGVTGLGSPIGDRFYIDYVAHEIGHQYGATHTFNGNAGSCCCGNRTAGTAYEPGSGSTVMAYAGICGSHNIQNFSDDYFHNISFQQIRSYTEAGTGSNCPALTATGNDAPLPDADFGGPYTVPISTPLQITGSGSDPNGDDFTYCWEERDLGPEGNPQTPSGNAPIFRSFLPTDSPTRVFPKILDIVNNVQIRGEILPTYDRLLRFSLTLRDGLGGVNYAFAQTTTVENAAGPFLVTGPNTGSEVWNAGTTETVTWDVAGTNANGVNCANVNILLSDDGGFTYPYTLLTNTPNDGSANVTVPGIVTSNARVKVEAADNIFFDISNEDFEIESDPTEVDDTVLSASSLVSNQPNPFNDITRIRFRVQETSKVTLHVYTTDGREVATLADNVLQPGEYSRAWDGTDYDLRDMPAGVYMYKLTIGDEVQSNQMIRIN